MASPTYNRESLFYSTPVAEEYRRPSMSLSPWNNFSHRPSADLSFTLPMPASDPNGTSRPQEPHNYRRESTAWQDLSSNSPNPQRQQPHASPPPAYLDLEEGDEFFGSTPDFDSFDWDSLPHSPPSQHTSTTTRESSIVDLTEALPTTTLPDTMPRTGNKRKPSGTDTERLSKRTKNEGASPGTSTVEEVESKSKENLEELDLIGVEDDTGYNEAMKKRQADLMKQQREDELNKPVKLATTQCVICLDQPEDLVVTHCGHMFCSLCLHGALNIDTGKRTCPVCRTPIGIPKKDGKKPRNGIFHLEMKVMSKKQGKKPALR